MSSASFSKKRHNMKKKRTTYGVSGMMEYQSLIRFGKNMLKVTFTGGSMNAIGVTPATYTTDNFLIQQAIENSDEYKRGRIRIVKAIDLEEDLRIERSVASGATDADGEAEIPAAPGATEVNESEEMPDNVEVVTAAEGEQRSAVTMTQVEFECNDDAKDYLEQTFGLLRSRLRNRDDIVNAGKANNVEIIFV